MLCITDRETTLETCNNIFFSFVRIRVDQILAVSWKLLLPATIVLLLVTGFVVALRGAGAA